MVKGVFPPAARYQRNMQYAAAPILADLQTKYRVVLYHGDTDMASAASSQGRLEQRTSTEYRNYKAFCCTYRDDIGMLFLSPLSERLR